MRFEYLEPVAGALLMLLFLADVFLTVLYARIGTGIFSVVVARSLWRIFRQLSQPFGPRRGSFLSFCGPVILVVLVLFWAIGLTLGTALIIHPKLGKSVVSSSGSTPTDFMTAMYAGGSSLSIVGAGNFSPNSGSMRMFYLLDSLVGMSVLSLTL
ncbi:MAG TPA: two pore domain potassium channel family protein, partial [Candidatus Angelobacter sp.]|nr:two pore domain potassium channel family protein [Candidatus Angelobacter sp.]